MLRQRRTRAGLRRLVHGRRGAVLGVVGRQGVGAAEVERAASVGAGGRGGANVDLLGRDGAVVADLAGGDAEGFLAEHVALLWKED